MQKQCYFGSQTKPLMIRTTDEKRDLLKVAAARRRESVNKMVNDWIDSVIQDESSTKKPLGLDIDS